MTATERTDKATATTIATAHDPILLYGTKEAAEYIGVSHQLIVDLCKNAGAPRHYLTGDNIDIYFDKATLDELRHRLGFDRTEGTHHVA